MRRNSNTTNDFPLSERDWKSRVRHYVDFDRIETLFQQGYVEDRVQVVMYISLSVVVWKVDDAQ